jgi:aspartyl-tRNA(Asn)/glutamyl-tRNA(Gln) amidotransferase subunit A
MNHAFLTISELSELIRTKQVSPVEVTKLMLQRIERLNPTLNAYITVTPDLAMTAAREAEAEIHRGSWRGPLHGVPIGVKDLFDTAGVKTTAASDLFKDRISNQDAEVVRKLKAAGAVLLGKHNMHEFAYGCSSTVSAFGPVRNPWNLEHSAGGSSGGTAAAIAAGLCFGGLGSDTGGSIREPAGYCGIVGLKPTYGLVSVDGVIPLARSLDHVGPMTRSVEDAAIMLRAIATYDERSISKLRVGIPRVFYFESLDPEIEAATNDAIIVLTKLVSSVEEVTTVPTNDIASRTLIGFEAYSVHADAVAKTPERYQPPTLTLLRAGAQISESDGLRAQQEVVHLRQEILKTFESVDVIITPTVPIPPPTIAAFDAAYSNPAAPATVSDIRRLPLRNTAPFNKYSIPTISIPCGFTRDGLPIGLQISGPPGGEAIVLQLAEAYEQSTDWHKKHPTAERKRDSAQH